MSENEAQRAPRPYIGMLFRCCHVYVRIYLNREGSAYSGRCPRCGAKAEITVGPDGSPARFWQAE
jgi:hypothetical protein